MAADNSKIIVNSTGTPTETLNNGQWGIDNKNGELYFGYDNRNKLLSRDRKLTKATFAQHGLVPNDGVNEIRPQDMFTEVDVADVLRLSDTAKGYKVRFTDGIYDMNQNDFQLPKAPFATGSTDELLASGSTTATNHSKADIVITGDTDTAYIALQDTTAGALLSDTSKFKPIPYVAKQIALLIEKTSTGSILNTVKPLVNMYGETDVEDYESKIFTELGYSQLKDRIWTDGSSEYVLIRLDVLGNDKGYHKFYNEMGWRQIDGSTKLGLDTTVSSTYQCFDSSHTLGTVSGRADSRNFNYRYIFGNGGGISFAIPNAKTPTYKHLEEVKRNLVDGYVETRNDITTQGFMTVVEELTDTSKTVWNLTYKAIEVYQVLYTTDGGVTWNTQAFTYNSVLNQITLGTARTNILVSYKAQNQSAIPIDTPQPIEVVDRDLIASNHNAVASYNGLVYASNGKIATGSSTVTKHIEDVVIDSNGSIVTTPKHGTIVLDNGSITGAKILVTQTANSTQVFTQEILPNGDTGDFKRLTNGTTTDWNNDTIQTKVLLKRSSCKVGE